MKLTKEEWKRVKREGRQRRRKERLRKEAELCKPLRIIVLPYLLRKNGLEPTFRKIKVWME